MDTYFILLFLRWRMTRLITTEPHITYYTTLHILPESVCPQPLLLTGHHGEISAMTFGKLSGPVLLCSASPDYIIVWDIELCHRRTQEGEEICIW